MSELTAREQSALDGFVADRQAARSPATYGEIWSSEWARSRLDTMFGVSGPQADAFEELRAGVETAAAGDIRTYARTVGLERDWLNAAGIDGRTKVLRQLAETFPDETKTWLMPLTDVRRRAAQAAHRLEAEAAEVAANTYGLSGHAVSFLAGTARQMVDPAMLLATAATLPIGGPAGQPIVREIARQAAAGAISQAAVEPAIQAERAELGLEAGFGLAAANIGQAAIGAGGLTAMFRGAAAGIRLLRGSPEAPISEPAPAPVPEPAAAAPISEPSRPTEAVPPTPAPLAEPPAIVTAADLTAPAPRPAAIVPAPEPTPAPVAAAPDSYQRAVELVRQEGKASPSFVQRKLGLKYSEAVALFNRMRTEGVIGEPDTAGRSPVLPAAAEIAPSGLPPEVRAVADQLAPADLEAVANLVERDAMVAGATPDRSIEGQTKHLERVEDATAAIEEGRPPASDAVPPGGREEITTVEVKPRKPTGRRAADPRTWSLLEFLASRGGLRDTPDLRAIFSGQNPFIPGWGRLLRKTGMTLDRAREASVEFKYLVDVPELEAQATGRPQTRPSETTTNTLLEAIDTEFNLKQPVYSLDKPPPAEVSRFDPDLDEAIRAGELPADIDPRLVRIMRQLYDQEGATLDDAYERAIMRDAERYERIARKYREQEPDPEEIPGWEFPVEPGAAPPDGGRVAEPRPGLDGRRPDEGGGVGEPPRPLGEPDREAAARGIGRRELGTEALSEQPFPPSEKVVLDTGRGEQFLIEGVAPVEATGLSAEYRAALAKHDAAQAEFAKVRDDYRARKIGDEEFNAAAQAMKAADREFDAAFAKEQTRAAEPSAPPAMPAGGLFDPAATSQADLLDAINAKVIPGTPEVLRDAARVLEEAGGDLQITLQNPDGTMRTVSARQALLEAAEDDAAGRQLFDCTGVPEGEQ